MNDQNTEYAILGGTVIVAAAGVIALLLYQAGLLFVLDGALAGAAYWFGYRNYKAGNLPAAKMVMLIAAIVTGLLALLSLTGNIAGFLIAGAAAGAFGYAFFQLNQNPAAAGSPDFSKTPGMQSTGSAPTPPASAPSHDIAARLRELAELKDKGLVTPAEYERKRAEILKGV